MRKGWKIGSIWLHRNSRVRGRCPFEWCGPRLTVRVIEEWSRFSETVMFVYEAALVVVLDAVQVMEDRGRGVNRRQPSVLSVTERLLGLKARMERCGSGRAEDTKMMAMKMKLFVGHVEAVVRKMQVSMLIDREGERKRIGGAESRGGGSAQR